MKILHIGLSATGSPLNGLQKALMKLGTYEEINTGTKNINDVIIKKSNSFKPDLVWMQIQAGGVVSNQTARHLKSIGAFTMNWTGDVRDPQPEWFKDFGRHIDLTTFSNQKDVDILNEKGVKSEFLQIGYDPEIYNPVGVRVNAPEIVFMGNNFGHFPLSGYRQKMVASLREKYENRFGVYGSGWNGATGNFMGNQKGEAQVLRSAKIIINLSHFDTYSSDRLFRALGSGGCVLSHNFYGVEKYKGGLDTWSDFEELERKINFYLSNEKERKEIAEKGNEIARSNHTFDCMAKDILSLYKKHKQ